MPGKKLRCGVGVLVEVLVVGRDLQKRTLTEIECRLECRKPGCSLKVGPNRVLRD